MRDSTISISDTLVGIFFLHSLSRVPCCMMNFPYIKISNTENRFFSFASIFFLSFQYIHFFLFIIIKVNEFGQFLKYVSVQFEFYSVLPHDLKARMECVAITKCVYAFVGTFQVDENRNNNTQHTAGANFRFVYLYIFIP